MAAGASAAAGTAAAGGGAAAGGISAGQLWALAGAGMLGGSALGTISSKKQMHYASDLMHIQQNWAERMSNTAHQREVDDLRKAGLNPILSATGGQGASTPSTGIGQVNAPNYGSIPEAIATAMQVKQADAQTKLMDQQALTEEKKREAFDADNHLTKLKSIEQEILNSNLPEKIKLEFKEMTSRTILNYATSSANQVNAHANQMTAEANKTNAESQAIDKEQKEEYNKWAKKHPYLKSVDQTLNRYFSGGLNFSKKLK